jgi:hypothetical protein
MHRPWRRGLRHPYRPLAKRSWATDAAAAGGRKSAGAAGCAGMIGQGRGYSSVSVREAWPARDQLCLFEAETPSGERVGGTNAEEAGDVRLGRRASRHQRVCVSVHPRSGVEGVRWRPARALWHRAGLLRRPLSDDWGQARQRRHPDPGSQAFKYELDLSPAARCCQGIGYSRK